MLASAVLITIVLFLLGASVGSFLNVVLYRSVMGSKWWWGRSVCDFCQKQLSWFDNVPILSYLVLQGKSRCCQEKLALTHPVIEILTGSLFVWWYWSGSLFFQLTRAPFQTLQPMFWLSVGILLIMIVVADALYLLIPDIAVGLLLLLTIGYRVGLTLFGIMQLNDLLTSVMGAILMVGFFAGLWLATKGRGMGLGDVKLVAPLSLLLGWPKVLVGMFLAFVTGAVVGLILVALGKRRLGQVVPFGPFLVLGSILALMVGEELLAWYTALL